MRKVNTSDWGCMNWVMFFALLVAILVVGTLFEAWVLMVVINWVLRLFAVAFVLSFKQAIGIAILLMVVGWFFKSPKND